jgi:SAM-dependent methyltransferase
VPGNLKGKKVLDIGASDGWFSFEMERRGAEVTAVDCVRNERFLLAHQLLGSRVNYLVADVHELTPDRIGRFDIVLLLGVLHCLRDPLLALENVCALTQNMALVESFVTDAGGTPQGGSKDIPTVEFFETDGLFGQFDIWVDPNIQGLLTSCRRAGFARVVLESVLERRAHISCFRC